MDAAEAFLAGVQQHKAATAATDEGVGAQQALTAATAPATEGVSRPDGVKVLLLFAAGVLLAVDTDKQAVEDDFKLICDPSSSVQHGSAPYAWSDDEMKFRCSSSTLLSKEFGTGITAEQVGVAEGIYKGSQDPAMNCPYSIEWLTRHESGDSYLDVQVAVQASGCNKQQKLQPKGVCSMVVLIAKAAGVAAVCEGKPELGTWGSWSALFAPPTAAVRDGRIVGDVTGITKAFAGGVDMLAPVSTADC